MRKINISFIEHQNPVYKRTKYEKIRKMSEIPKILENPEECYSVTVEVNKLFAFVYVFVTEVPCMYRAVKDSAVKF